MKNRNRSIATVVPVVLLLLTVCVPTASGTEYRVSFSNSSGFSVWAREGGGGPPYGSGLWRGQVMASFTGSPSPHLFAKWILTDTNGGSLENGDHVYLRTAANGQFMCAENGGGGNVNANRVSPGGWETFTIHKVGGSGTTISDNDDIALQASNGMFLCAQNGGGTYVIADRSGIGSWETFRFHNLGTGAPYWTVPQFDPFNWNDYDEDFPGTSPLLNNNCYNYGANRLLNIRGVPGRASGSPVPEGAFTSAQLTSSMIADGWEQTDAYTPSPEGKMRVFIALKPYPGLPNWWKDYHCYRKDVGGTWSGKPGTSPATNLDYSGLVVLNPETCNRGSYTSDLGYWFIPTFSFQGSGYANIY